jgi:hypothetical protein
MNCGHAPADARAAFQVSCATVLKNERSRRFSMGTLAMHELLRDVLEVEERSGAVCSSPTQLHHAAVCGDMLAIAKVGCAAPDLGTL